MPKQSHDETAHLDGIRPICSETDKEYLVSLGVMLGGAVDEVNFSEMVQVIKIAKKDHGAASRLQHQLHVVTAICDFLNAGGTGMQLHRFASLALQFAAFNPEYKVVHYLAGTPPVVIYRKADGSYLRVVPGEEGFTDYFPDKRALLSALRPPQRRVIDKVVKDIHAQMEVNSHVNGGAAGS